MNPEVTLITGFNLSVGRTIAITLVTITKKIGTAFSYITQLIDNAIACVNSRDNLPNIIKNGYE